MPKNVSVSAAAEFPELVDIKKLAELLSVNVRQLRRLVLNKDIPYTKIGRLLRFDLHAIASWLEEHTIRSPGRMAA